jgi:hypothetical protein
MKLKFSLLVSVLCSTATAFASAPTFAADDSGLLLGAGLIRMATPHCDDCSESEDYLEVGYDINQTFGFEAKYSDAEFGDSIAYIGSNIGSDFNRAWVNVYGKLGIAFTDRSGGADSRARDFNSAFGLGVRFTPTNEQRGFYVKIEALSSQHRNESINAACVGLGFKL